MPNYDGGSLKVGSSLSSGVLGPLSAPSTCGIPPGVAEVTGDLLLLGVSLRKFMYYNHIRKS